MKFPRLNRRFARFLIAMTALFASFGIAVAIDVQPAAASSTHCAWISPKKIAGVGFPEGQYCFSISGSGLYVNNTQSSFWSSWTENLSERVDAVDMQSSVYASSWTYKGYGTLYGTHAWTTGVRGNARPGSLCGHLFSNGIEIAVVCGGVHN